MTVDWNLSSGCCPVGFAYAKVERRVAYKAVFSVQVKMKDGCMPQMINYVGIRS